jgi:hypothetical protein
MGVLFVQYILRPGRIEEQYHQFMNLSGEREYRFAETGAARNDQNGELAIPRGKACEVAGGSDGAGDVSNRSDDKPYSEAVSITGTNGGTSSASKNHPYRNHHLVLRRITCIHADRLPAGCLVSVFRF